MGEAAGDLRVEFLGELQRLSVGPGDRFVLTSRVALPGEMHARIAQLWRDYWSDRPGEPPRLLILDDGLALGAVREGAR